MTDQRELEIIRADIAQTKADLEAARTRGDIDHVKICQALLVEQLKEMNHLLHHRSSEPDLELREAIYETHKLVAAMFSIQGDAVLLDAVSTDSERQVHSFRFENDVTNTYGCINASYPNMLRCVVTGQFHSQEKVCKGAQLLAIEDIRAMSLLGLNRCDIWDSRNGLCILRTIDKRFQSKELVYMPIPGSPDSYRIVVLYDDIVPLELGITIGELNSGTDTTPATFADINGRQLSFVTPFRPYSRVLLLIALSAFTLALKNTRRVHTLATAAAPPSEEAWRNLFDSASAAGSPPLSPDSFIMQRFLRG